MDHELCRRRPCQLVAGDQGKAAPGSGGSGGRGDRGQPRLLRREVLPAASFPAGGVDGVAAAGGAAAFGERGGLMRGWTPAPCRRLAGGCWRRNGTEEFACHTSITMRHT